MRRAWALPMAGLLLLAGCLGPAQPGAPVQPASTDPEALPHSHGLSPLAGFTWRPAEPIAGQPVTFLDRSTDPDDGLAGHAWEFGDGGLSTEAEPQHTFREAGRYLVKLTVRDQGGLTASVAQVVLVQAGAGGGAPLEPAGPRPHVVVAVVDTGINPYHAAFQSSAPLEPSLALPGYPAAQPLRLSLGSDYAAARKADDALWKAVEEGQLYWFPGTRIVGAISFGNGTFGNAADNTHRVLDDDGHGTATSSRVALSGPDVWLVMVEAGSDGIDEALAWAADQPWIDVISLSFGPELNLPLALPAAKLGELDLATRRAVESGKLVFAAAGNDPTLSSTSHINGPPWVISVGGALPQGMGDPATTSKAMDIVSDYRPLVAKHDSREATEPLAGTSFSAPTAAGAVAEALYLARAQIGSAEGILEGKLILRGPGLLAGGLTNLEVRSAMEGVARYWEPAMWQPVEGVPILPAPWLQMGWGYVGPEDTPALTTALLTGEVPAKPEEARSYMAANMAVREALWA